jgi:hypothetical protein
MAGKELWVGKEPRTERKPKSKLIELLATCEATHCFSPLLGQGRASRGIHPLHKLKLAVATTDLKKMNIIGTRMQGDSSCPNGNTTDYFSLPS